MPILRFATNISQTVRLRSLEGKQVDSQFGGTQWMFQADEGNFYVSDWTLSHANFFRSIEITKSIMFVILLMAVGVAAFNIVATLVMIVKEKQTDIAILRTLGAGPRNVLLTFAIQGVAIGLAGTVLGAALGVVLSDNLQSIIDALQRLIGVQFLDASVYLMNELPAYVEWGDLLKV